MTSFLYKHIMTLFAPVITFNESLLYSLTPSERRHRRGTAPLYPPNTCTLWLDGYSLADLNAAYNIILALSNHSSPALLHFNTILFTSSTVHAIRALSVRLSSLQPHLPNHNLHAELLPADSPVAVRRFFDATSILAGVFVKYPPAPSLLSDATRRRIPLALVDARLSPFSHRVCFFARSVATAAYSSFRFVAAQTEDDANRILAFRKSPVLQRASLKFLSNDWIRPCSSQDVQTFCDAVSGRRVWLAVNTHEGDEFLVLAAHAKLRKRPGLENLLLIMAPWSPARGVAVVKMAAKLGFIGEMTERRMEGNLVPGRSVAVYVADTSGELSLFYSACEVALIGDSFSRKGRGHSFVEAAHFGVPVLHGPRFDAFGPLASVVMSVIKEDVAMEKDGKGCVWREACMKAANSEQIEELVAAAFLQRERTRTLGTAFQTAVRRLNETVERQIVELMEELIGEAAPEHED